MLKKKKKVAIFKCYKFCIFDWKVKYIVIIMLLYLFVFIVIELNVF